MCAFNEQAASLVFLCFLCIPVLVACHNVLSGCCPRYWQGLGASALKVSFDLSSKEKKQLKTNHLLVRDNPDHPVHLHFVGSESYSYSAMAVQVAFCCFVLVIPPYGYTTVVLTLATSNSLTMWLKI